ncbi:hypothetical protein M514_01918, partial [Trichuris suis]
LECVRYFCSSVFADQPPERQTVVSNLSWRHFAPFVSSRVSEGCSRIIVLIDDNMHLRSMRHSFYLLARERKIGFGQIAVQTDVDVAVRRNALRTGGIRVDEEVIFNMAEKMQMPDANRFHWERNTLLLNELRDDAEFLLVRSFLIHCLSEACIPSPKIEVTIGVANENSLSNNLYRCDIALRRIVAEEVTNISRGFMDQKLDLHLQFRWDAPKLMDHLHGKSASTCSVVWLLTRLRHLVSTNETSGFPSVLRTDESVNIFAMDPLLPKDQCYVEAINDSATGRSVGVDVQSFSENLCSIRGHSRFKLSAGDVASKKRENESSESTVVLPCQGASEPVMVEEKHRLVASVKNLQTALNGQQAARLNTRVQLPQTPDDATLHLPCETDPVVGHGSASKSPRYDSRRYRLNVRYRFAGEYRSQIVPPPNRTVFDAPDCMCDFSIVDHTAVPKNTSFCFLTKSACQKKRSGVKKHANRSCNGHASTGESTTKAAKFSHCSPDSPAYILQSGVSHSAQTSPQTNHLRDHNSAIKSSSQSSTQRLLKRWPLNFGGRSDANAKH